MEAETLPFIGYIEPWQPAHQNISSIGSLAVAAAQSALLQELRVGRSDDAALAGALASQAYLGRTYAFSKEYEARVRAVTPKTAQAALRKYVDPAKLVIVRAGTFK